MLLEEEGWLFSPRGLHLFGSSPLVDTTPNAMPRHATLLRYTPPRADPVGLEAKKLLTPNQYCCGCYEGLRSQDTEAPINVPYLL
jgi:hypothetical protein